MVPNVESLIIKVGWGGGGRIGDKLFYIFLLSFLFLKHLFADMLKELGITKKGLETIALS